VLPRHAGRIEPDLNARIEPYQILPGRQRDLPEGRQDPVLEIERGPGRFRFRQFRRGPVVRGEGLTRGRERALS
jgi:hypothetical protein